MLDSKKRYLKDKDKNRHTFIDISNYSGSEQYVCEYCGTYLVLFPQARIANPHAGISYICPQCHNVTDSALKGLQHADEIKPLDIATPSFNIVPEKKGSDILFRQYYDVNDHDPEPQEEAILKAQGATIIEKKIEATNDFA
jgi:hypothetical protein